uniref:GOLD domain-containing protein n=1 Tax=Romanomermis culicivorax TaxID=13658 RepID=A0A915HM21_ROMCU
MDIRLSFLVFLYQFYLHALHASEYSYTVEVDGSNYECFFQSFENETGVTMEVDYQVTDGGDLDIDFYVLDHLGSKILTSQRSGDGTHKVKIPQDKADYEICFDNLFSYTPKKVFFQIYILDAEGNIAGEPKVSEYAAVSRLLEEIGVTANQFTEISSKIKTNMNKMEQVQVIMRAYESRDRAIMDANYDRINFWSALNLIVMLTVAAAQVRLVGLYDSASISRSKRLTYTDSYVKLFKYCLLIVLLYFDNFVCKRDIFRWETKKVPYCCRF